MGGSLYNIVSTGLWMFMVDVSMVYNDNFNVITSITVIYGRYTCSPMHGPNQVHAPLKETSFNLI